MRACAGSALTMLISTRSTAGIRQLRSRRRSKRCMKSSRPARHVISALPPCLPGSSPGAGDLQAYGWARFVSMQNFVNLIYREEEREMLPLCKSEGIGVIPGARWRGPAGASLERGGDESLREGLVRARIYANVAEGDRQIIDEVGEIASRRNIPRAQVALAWLLRKPEITAPIIGATKPQHLQDAAAALDVQLTEDEVKALEAPYAPHPVAGISW